MAIAWMLLLGAPLVGGAMGLATSHANQKLMRFFMAFSGGFLLAVCAAHLFPEAYKQLPAATAGLFVLVGFGLQIFIDMFSEGVEHGHMHAAHAHECEGHAHTHRKAGALAFSLLASLSVHSFLEGMPLNGPFGLAQPLQSNAVFWGIVLHKAPAAFALATILKAQAVPMKQIIAMVACYALVTPLGVMAGGWLLHQPLAGATALFPYISAVVSGSFFHIATTVLLESSADHRPKPLALLAGAIGCALALLIL